MSDNVIQVYTIYIDAPAAKVWEGITQSKYTTQWGYGGDSEYDLVPGGSYRNLATADMKEMGMGDVAVSGEVLDVDPPNRLSLTWLPAWRADEPATTLTWELTEYPSGLTKLVLTHDLTNNPSLAVEVAGGGEPASGGGGWPWCLSGLKTVMETGASMDTPAA